MNYASKGLNAAPLLCLFVQHTDCVHWKGRPNKQAGAAYMGGESFIMTDES